MMKSKLSKKILPIYILLALLLSGCTKTYQIGDGDNRGVYGFGVVKSKCASFQGECPIAEAVVSANGIKIEMPKDKNKQTTGYYVILGSPGTYTLQVSAPGYKSTSVEVELKAGELINEDIWLEPVSSKEDERP